MDDLGMVIEKTRVKYGNDVANNAIAGLNARPMYRSISQFELCLRWELMRKANGKYDGERVFTTDSDG